MRLHASNNHWTPAAALRPPSLLLRLRFTLIYGLILALTLLAFGAVSYGAIAQPIAQAAQAERNALVSEGAALAASLSTDRAWPLQAVQLPPLTDSAIRISHLDGTPWRSPRSRANTPTLPLDRATLAAIRRGSAYGPTTIPISGRPTLLYALPIVRARRVVAVLQVARPMRDGSSLLGALLIALLAGCAIATLLLFGVGWLLAGIILRPLDRVPGTRTNPAHDVAPRPPHPAGDR
jgi:hypothetical protein